MTLYGDQTPTVRVMPEYGRTLGGKAEKVLDLAGVRLMPWQRDVLNDWLAVEDAPDGVLPQFTAGTCGLCLPRQNGKTLLVVARCVYGMVGCGEWVVYTAHLQKTATETFEEIRGIFESPALRKYVKEIRQALGREEIVLNNGGRIKFLARTRNGGRGQHGDVWIVDEAQELTAEQEGSFTPLRAASKRPQTIMLGTPPDENSPGEVFARMRARALEGETKATCWTEWSVEDAEDIGDREKWARTNPSLGHLILETTIAAEYEQMGAEQFARERLGWWKPGGVSVEHVISADDWAKCLNENPSDEGLWTFAVKFAVDGTRGTVAYCVKPKEGAAYVEVVDVVPLFDGIGEIADWLIARKGKAAQVVIDGAAYSADLALRLKRGGYGKRAIILPGAREAIGAMSTFVTAVREQAVTHNGSPSLDASATLTAKRPIGRYGGYGFGDTEEGDATLVEACAFAYWAAVTTKRDPSRKMRVA